MTKVDRDRVFEELGRCKSLSTCQNLGLRHLYFEPNPGTMDVWRREHGFYADGIDRRVLFICESPSDRRPKKEQAHFQVRTAPGWICWNYSPQDARFREARVRYGFQHCAITNAVKCGPVGNVRPGGPTEEEAERCSKFLRHEIEALQPVVLGCMGERALRMVLRHTIPFLFYSPAVVPLTHYSARNSADSLKARWADEFGRLKAALRSRGFSDSTPLWT